jgi:hypothetical protein
MNYIERGHTVGAPMGGPSRYVGFHLRDPEKLIIWWPERLTEVCSALPVSPAHRIVRGALTREVRTGGRRPGAG